MGKNSLPVERRGIPIRTRLWGGYPHLCSLSCPLGHPTFWASPHPSPPPLPRLPSLHNLTLHVCTDADTQGPMLPPQHTDLTQGCLSTCDSVAGNQGSSRDSDDENQPVRGVRTNNWWQRDALGQETIDKLTDTQQPHFLDYFLPSWIWYWSVILRFKVSSGFLLPQGDVCSYLFFSFN